MSFILDAVKKSEQERRYTQMDSVQSWYYQPQSPKPKKHYWVGIMVFINTLVLAGLVIWLVKPVWLPPLPAVLSDLVQDTLEAPSMVSGANIEPLSAIDAQAAAPVTPQSLVESPSASEVITPSVSLSDPQTQATAMDLKSVPDLEALPESIMIHIPAIAFSSHLFSSEPTARQVVVNGQKLRQGDYLNRDLQLLEIQEKTVVFQQFQYPFKVLLSRYWVRDE